MASSTESKLKSKYDSSSKKIQELYEEFSAMRRNINTPSKRQKDDSISNASIERRQRQLFGNSIDVSIPRGPKLRQLTKNEGPIGLPFQTQTFLKNACLKNLTCCFIQMDKKIDSKVGLMESRLKNLNNLFTELTIFYKIKVQNLKSTNKAKCKCSQMQEILKQVESKYDKKVKQLKAMYENKISLLVKQHNGQDTSDSSNPKRNSNKHLQDQLQQLEDKLIVKQQQITALKLQNCKLRRSSDQVKSLLSENQSLVRELTKQIAQKQSKIDQLLKFQIEKIVSSNKICNDCQEYKQDIKNMKIENQKQNKQKIKIEKEELKQKNEQQQKKQKEEIYGSQKRKCSWDQSEIQKHQIVHSDYEQQNQIVSHLQNDQNYEPLRHTQYFNPKRKNSYKSVQKIKELQSQIQLVTQQNRLLKAEKDKFEEQVKEDQGDQQRFQLQCQILREQLKKVNVDLRLLDECSVVFLKQKKVPEEKIEKLSDLLKFKEEYFKKFPKSKQKSSNKS